MAQITAKFKLQRRTPGAGQYAEVDENGKVYRAPNEPGCKIGNLYIRKDAVRPADLPEEIEVIVNWKE